MNSNQSTKSRTSSLNYQSTHIPSSASSLSTSPSNSFALKPKRILTRLNSGISNLTETSIKEESECDLYSETDSSVKDHHHNCCARKISNEPDDDAFYEASSQELLNRYQDLPTDQDDGSEINNNVKNYIYDSEDDDPDDDDSENGKLIGEEEREKGSINKQIYLYYLKACSISLSCLVLSLIFMTQAIKIGSDFWLAKWSNSDEQHLNALNLTQHNLTQYNLNRFNLTRDSLTHNQSILTNEQNEDLGYYITGYSILSLITIILSFVTNLSSQLTSLKAVRLLHERLLNTIICCPMKFFDTTPIGRILNRFSSDIGVIDKVIC